MIGIVDYGAGNLHSVKKALDFLGCDARILRSPGQAGDADRLILPGVGAFGAASQRLRAAGWMGFLRDWTAEGRPFLGICLGMQLLFDSSVESEGAVGLNVFRGICRKLSADKVPQIGWNGVHRLRGGPFLDPLPDGEHYYFVHGYYVEPAHEDVILGATEYGGRYASVVGRGRVYGVQFHPEKSGPAGMKLIRNWVEKC